MADKSRNTDGFFDHFSRGDTPTKAGRSLVIALARKLFASTEVSEGASVLEIGPGRGDFADICLKQGIDYTAVEANQCMAESLEKRGATVIRAKVPPLPAVDKQFDAVAMINVMEHMSTMPDAMEVARQVHEILKPGGRFLICSPDYLNWRKHFFNCDFSHNYVTTRRRLEQLLINAGFAQPSSFHTCGPFDGMACYFMSSLIGHMPFASLNSAFPNSRFCYKLYKSQLTFLRKVVVVGKKPA